MSKKNLRKRLTAFVNQLTPDQVREQLVLAYLQMEKCKNVLKGYDVEPVEMMDNGESSDLELFYRCKKAAEELSYLNEMVSKPDKTIKFGVDVDFSEAINQLRKFYEQLTKVGKATKKHNIPNDAFVLKVDLHKFYEPLKFDTSNDLDKFKLREHLRKMAESMKLRVLEVGTEVYYLSKGRIHKSVVENFVGLVSENGMPVCKVKGNDNAIPATYLYDSAVRLASHVGKTVSDHISLSSDHESAYFIDSTSRIFKAAKWYLEDQKIVNFDSINDLRSYLLSNVIDDTKK